MNKRVKCRYGEMVYQTTDSTLGKCLELYGEFSEGEVALFRKVVQPGFVVLDVGANIGALTIPFAQFAGPNGRVLAFEPQRIGYYTLCANVVLNNLFNTNCYNAAIDHKEGWLDIPELDYNVVQSFGSLNLTMLPAGIPGHRTTVMTVDSLHLNRCDFVKVDVERMEERALCGAAETIRRCRPILYVEDSGKEHSAGLRAFIDSLGYRMYQHWPPLFNPDNFLGNRDNCFPYGVSKNLFCHPKESLPNLHPLEFQMIPVDVSRL